MKQVIMKRKRDKVDSIKGWLFTYAGLQLVAMKEFTNCKWWRVYEYSTGYQIGGSKTTRRETISAARQLLDRLGSRRICQGVHIAIRDSGILNS